MLITLFGPLVKRLRRSPLKAESWVRFPYGSPHYDTPEWLYRAVWECFFLYGFWSCPLFGLYFKATRFSLLFEIFDFGNSRGSYFEFMVFKQGIRLFAALLFFFIKDKCVGDCPARRCLCFLEHMTVDVRCR